MAISTRLLLAAFAVIIATGMASVGEARAEPLEAEIWPIYPAYPYRAGHYPKVDWYADMPPYTAISPSFYRKRHFMLAQERDRYRYMPHVFHGSDGYGDNYMK